MAKTKSSIASLIQSQGNVPVKEKKGFNLDDFKSKNGLVANTAMKDEEYLKVSPDLCEVLGIEGIPMFGLTLTIGHSDSGKTTLLIEAAIACQKQGIMPILIVTEMKWNWKHALEMGFQATEIFDENGEHSGYEGNFIYVDAEDCPTIESVAAFMNNFLKLQRSGEFPHHMYFLWDSVGSVICQRSYENGTNNNEWNAGAISTQFKGRTIEEIGKSRKKSYPYSNGALFVNHIWLEKSTMPGIPPTLKLWGGDSLYKIAKLIIQFGGVKTSSTEELKATANGKSILYGRRTKVKVKKNHDSEFSSDGKILLTGKGFIADTKEAENEYKKSRREYWLERLGTTEFEVVVDKDENE